MGLRSMLESMRKKNAYYNEYDAQDKAMQKVEERKLSSNERELNKILKQKREIAIKQQLDKYHKQERKEYWHKDVITQPMIFREKKTLLSQKNIFSGGNS